MVTAEEKLRGKWDTQRMFAAGEKLFMVSLVQEIGGTNLHVRNLKILKIRFTPVKRVMQV